MQGDVGKKLRFNQVSLGAISVDESLIFRQILQRQIFAIDQSAFVASQYAPVLVIDDHRSDLVRVIDLVTGRQPQPKLPIFRRGQTSIFVEGKSLSYVFPQKDTVATEYISAQYFFINTAAERVDPVKQLAIGVLH